MSLMPRDFGQGHLSELIAHIPPLDEHALVASRQRQDLLTKPPGSLGRLERLATQLAGITGSARPRLPRKAVIVIAADHGVAREGVSAYPPQVTAQMVRNSPMAGPPSTCRAPGWRAGHRRGHWSGIRAPVEPAHPAPQSRFLARRIWLRDQP